MSLDVLLEPVVPKEVVRRCKVGLFYDSLEEKYQTALFGLLFTRVEDGGLTTPDLRARLKQAGCDVGDTVLHNHRKGKCACR